MARLIFPVFSRITKNGLSPAYSQDAEHLPESKIYDMGKKEYNGLIFLKLFKNLGAPPKTAAALPPVSAAGLGLPRPYAACAAGPGSIVLQHDLRSCLARRAVTGSYTFSRDSNRDINPLSEKLTFVKRIS
jgi:hypothetical protein